MKTPRRDWQGCVPLLPKSHGRQARLRLEKLKEGHARFVPRHLFPLKGRRLKEGEVPQACIYNAQRPVPSSKVLSAMHSQFCFSSEAAKRASDPASAVISRDQSLKPAIVT